MAQGGFLVCHGAICTCTLGAAPSPLQVITQFKTFVNDSSGAQKKIATNKDTSPAAVNFAVCRPGTMSATPCAASLQWSGFYDKVTLINGGKILLDSSRAQCSMGGMVSIVNHGQIPVPDASSLNSTDSTLQCQINPLINYDEVKRKIANSAQCQSGGNAAIIVGDTQVTPVNYEPCKYTGITVSDAESVAKADKQNDNAATRTTKLFEEGKSAIANQRFDIIAGGKNHARKIKISLDGTKTDKCVSEPKHTPDTIFLYGEAIQKYVKQQTRDELLLNLFFLFDTEQQKIDDTLKDESDKPNSVERKYNKVVDAVEKNAIVKAADSVIVVLKYIWPKGEKVVQPYYIDVSTCRYSKDVLLNVYPDINWELALTYVREKDRIKERGAIFQKTEAIAKSVSSATAENTFDLSLEAKWDGDSQTSQLNKNYFKRIEGFVTKVEQMIALVEKIRDSATGGGSGMQKTEQVKKSSVSAFVVPSYTFEVEPPVLACHIKWGLKPSATNNNNAAVVGTLDFSAKPLVAANFTIDLLSVAAKGNPLITLIVGALRLSLNQLDGQLKANFKIFGKLEVEIEALTISSEDASENAGSDDAKTPVEEIDGELGVDLDISLSAKGHFKAMLFTVDFSFSANAKAEAYFGGTVALKADQAGVYADMSLKFSGLLLSASISAKAGMVTLIDAEYNNDEAPIWKSEDVETSKYYLVKADE